MDAARAKRWAKRGGIAAGGLALVLLLALGALFVWLGTDSARRTVLGFAQSALAEQGLYLKAEETSGQLPFSLVLKKLSLADESGEWLELGEAVIELDPFSLLSLTVHVEKLGLEGLSVLRLPELPPGREEGAAARGGPVSLPVNIRLDDFSLRESWLGPDFLAALAPERRKGIMAMGRADINLRASANLEGGGVFDPGKISLKADGAVKFGRGGRLGLALLAGPEAGERDALRLALELSEEAGGLLASFIGQDALPAYSLKIESNSNLNDIRLELELEAERLASASGTLQLAPLGKGDRLERLGGPDWSLEGALALRPGPLLREEGGVFAVLPEAALDFMRDELRLAAHLRSEAGKDGFALHIDALRLENDLAALGAERAVLRLGGQSLGFDGALLAQVKGEKFFEIAGAVSDATPMFGKSALRLDASARADFAGAGPKASFSLKGPLETESRHPLFSGDDIGPLKADLELAGQYDGDLKLELVRASGLGLAFDGKSSLAFSPLLIKLDGSFSGERQGVWNNILTHLSGGIPPLGLEGTLEARLDLGPDNGGDELSATVRAAASEFGWPADELGQALGTYLALEGRFSGPLLSPYQIDVDGLLTGFEPVQAAAYDEAAPVEGLKGARARGRLELSIPGTSPREVLPRFSKERQQELVTLNGQVDFTLGDAGLFLPDGETLSGPLRGTASISGVAGGNDTSLRLEADVSNNNLSPLSSPAGVFVLEAKAAADLIVGRDLNILGNFRLDGESDKAGALRFASGWQVAQAEGGPVRLALKELDSSFAGLALQGGVSAVLPDTEGEMPCLTGDIAAHFENWKDLNDTFDKLGLSVPLLSGSPMDLRISLEAAPGGVQSAKVDFDLERLHVLLGDDRNAAALPAPGENQPPLGTPGLALLNKIEGRLALDDLWGKRLLSAHLKTDSGSVDLESWGSFAACLDLSGSVGRINLAMRSDAEALKVLRAIDGGGPFNAQRAEAALRGGGDKSAQSQQPVLLEGQKAAAGLEEQEMAILSGVFRLRPLTIRLEQAALYAPEYEAGMYLQNPAYLRVQDDIRLENLNFAVLPGGHLKADAYFSAGESRATANIKDFPLAFLRKLSGLPLPDGELNLQSNMLASGGEISGEAELRAFLRHPKARADGDAATPLVLNLRSTLGRKSGEFGLPVGPGVVRIIGNGSLGGANGHDSARDLALAFDLPFSSGPQGLLVPDFNSPLGARLSWKGSLADVWGVFPIADRDISGLAQLDFTLGGSLAHLKYGGSAYIADGMYRDRIYGVMLDDINLELSSGGSGTRAVVSATDGRSGKAAFEARLDDGGELVTGLGSKAGLRLPGLVARGQVNQLAPLHRDDFSVRFSGVLDAAGPLNAPLIKGDFIVEEGNVNLMSSLGGGVTTLPVEDKSNLDVEKRVNSGAELDIKVSAPGRFYVRGAGLDSEWRVDASVQGPASSPNYVAAITPVRGYFELLSRPFALSRGKINVWGGRDYFDSSLDLLLTYTSSSLTAEISAGGSLKRPTLTLGSTPALPQDQILSQVIFGKDITQLTALEALQVANGVRQIMSFGQGGFDLVGELRDLLGVDTLRIGSTATGPNSGSISGSPDASAFGVGGAAAEQEASPTVEAGKYLNDSVYVGVEQGAVENSTRVRLEIELKPNLTLQGSSGSQSSQVGIGWKRDY